jgi:LCP family protein required for cell wall assembly
MPGAEGDQDTEGGQGGETASGDPKRTGRRRILLVILAVLLVVAGGVAGGLYVVSERLAGNVQRVPAVFDGLDPDERPAEPTGPAADALTFLLVGTDSRSAEPTTGTSAEAPSFEYGAQRSDVIMLARISADRTRAALVSIPRDTWIDIPDHGKAKINAAYSYGGDTLLVETIESLTQVRVDHFAVIDFAGFQAMTDAVGGIDVEVEEATSNFGVDFHAGVNHLNGEEALAYVRQRFGLPRGDLDRVQRQQNALRALLAKAMSADTLRNPARAYDFLDAVTRSVGVDDTLGNDDLRSLFFSLRSLRADDITFLTAPVTGTGMEGDQSVVYLDQERAARLWRAFDSGDLDTYVRNNEGDLLGTTIP